MLPVHRKSRSKRVLDFQAPQLTFINTIRSVRFGDLPVCHVRLPKREWVGRPVSPDRFRRSRHTHRPWCLTLLKEIVPSTWKYIFSLDFMQLTFTFSCLPYTCAAIDRNRENRYVQR